MPATMPTESPDIAQLQQQFAASDQSQVFQYLAELSADERRQLAEQLAQIDPARVQQIFRQTMARAQQLGQGGRR